jgi:Mrp family chromosome partitioning ATPase
MTVGPEVARERGTKTPLLEADLRRQHLATHYGLAAPPGLSELLIGGVSVHEAIRQVPIAAPVDGSESEVSLVGLPPVIRLRILLSSWRAMR